MSKYGPMTVERHAELKKRGIDVRVFYKGVDVTERCMFADDEAETVTLLCQDPQRHDWRRSGHGAHLMPDDWDQGVCKFEFTGDVVMRP